MTDPIILELLNLLLMTPTIIMPPISGVVDEVFEIDYRGLLLFID